ncbi:type II secretion system protein [Clostridium drakei]|uniref:Prepilin-type cleavage/methylation domain-containing protein n=1 Tax=Clostridium drakei TaxID=332101 RepID=A0A2U8DM36_9CLOT|nr:type II secretion system protein [Clostridium drakei]AWI03769.1 prepilin-type cleavage/methylation domain-containing protein [Clostridium drakei]
MNSIRENIKNKICIKKGFTLIELMLVVSIIGIITSVQAIVMCKYMKVYRQEINSSRESFYINEAFNLIYQEINNEGYVKTENNNVIVIRRYDGRGFNYIRTNRDSDIIISYYSKYYSTTNNILKNIKDFKVEKDRQVLYVSIETRKGNVYKRCFPLKIEEDQKGSL